MLGRKLILLGVKNPISFWSEIFRCVEVLLLIPVCIWMLEFLSWGSWLPQLSVVYCCLIFMVFFLKHADFMAKNLLVVTVFTWDARCTKWDQTVLKKVILGLVSIGQLCPLHFIRSQGCLEVSHDLKRCCQEDCSLSFTLYLSQGQTRVGMLSHLRWNCIREEFPDKSKPVPRGEGVSHSLC